VNEDSYSSSLSKSTTKTSDSEESSQSSALNDWFQWSLMQNSD